MTPMLLAHFLELRADAVDIAPQSRPQHKKLLLTGQRGKVGRLRSELGVQLGEPFFSLGIDEQSVDQVQKVITRRSANGPGFAQALFGLKDLLTYDPGAGRRGPQALEVFLRVVQAVRMIHSHSIQNTAGQPAQDLVMRVREYLFVFRPKTNQRVDIKKTSVPQLLTGSAPISQPVILAAEQPVKLVGIRVEIRDGLIHRACDVRLLHAERRECFLENLLIAMPSPHIAPVRCSGNGEASESVR